MGEGLFIEVWGRDANSHTTRKSHLTTDAGFPTAALLRILTSLANFSLYTLQGHVQLGQNPTQLAEQSTTFHDGPQ